MFEFATLITGGLGWVGSNLASYLFRKGMDRIFSTKEDLEKELTIVINEVVDEYEKQSPQQDISGMYAFYKSQKVIDELLQYRLMHPDEYKAEQLFDAFNQDNRVIPPTLPQITTFYDIFVQKVKEHPKLKSIEINSTFQEEIFEISSKLDNLSRKIEYILRLSNADLELQWKDRIDAYVSTLKSFKPETALELLIALEKSFELSTKKPTEEFKAAIKYQKGICYQFLGNKDEYCKAFIMAQTLNPSVQSYKEKAALAYYRLSNSEEALKLSLELLKDNPFNPIANSIIVLTSDDIESAINNISPIVYTDVLFQSILWHDFAPDYTKTQILEKKNLIPQRNDISILKIDIDNFSQTIFYIEILLTDFVRAYNYIGFLKLEHIDSGLFTLLDQLFEKLLSEIKNTEMESKLYMLFFYAAFTKYVLTSNKEYVLQMREFYPKFSSDDIFFCSLCANCLQMENYIDFALDIIDTAKSVNFELFYLKAFCYIKKNNIEQYVKYIKEGISSLTTVDSRIEYAYLFMIISLKTSTNLEDVESGFFWKSKIFDNPEFEKLIKVGCSCLKKSSIEENEKDEIKTLIEVFKKDKFPSLFIANVYFFCTHYQKAVDIYEKHIDTEHESKELLFYIMSLEKLNTGSAKLIFLLEKWRQNYNYDERLLRLEANLHSAALNWEKCIEISDYVLQNYPSNDAFLVLKIIAADRLEKKELLDNTIADYLQIEIHELDNISTVIEIFNRRGYLDEAVDILYGCIDRDKDNSLLLMLYMNTSLNYSNQKKNKFQQFEEVQEDCFIKYQINNNTKFAEIKGKGIGGMFEGKKVGDTFTYGSYTISILRIMDKYLYLHDLIFQKVYEMPPELSGLPMESFSIDSSNPQSFLEMLKEKFGDAENDRQEAAQELLDGYYNRTVSYTEIIMNLCNGDYLAGYFYLSFAKNGIVTIPATFFNQFEYPDTSQYIIDLSTLPILYQIANKHNIKYPVKLHISKYHIEILKRTLHKIQTDPTSTLSVVVTKEDVTKIETPANAKENDIDYLTNLIEWIKSNCVEVVEPDTLDLKRALQEKDIRTQSFADYFVNTCSYSHNKNAIIITDDILYIKFKFAPVNSLISSEAFVRNILGDEHPALNEFIINKYIGYSPTFHQLKNEFDQRLNGNKNDYEFCIKNINPGIFAIIIDFLVYISKHQGLSDKEKAKEVEFVILSLFQNISNRKIIEYFCALIELKSRELNIIEANIIIGSLNVLDGFIPQE
jgi:hypothetical protein